MHLVERVASSIPRMQEAMKEANLKGIYACGDITRSGGSVAFSVADGALAGVAVHKSFIFNT